MDIAFIGPLVILYSLAELCMQPNGQENLIHICPAELEKSAFHQVEVAFDSHLLMMRSF